MVGLNWIPERDRNRRHEKGGSGATGAVQGSFLLLHRIVQWLSSHSRNMWGGTCNDSPSMG